MSCEKFTPPPIRVKRREAESEPDETRLASLASCAVSEPVKVGNSPDRASRTTWCCASASKWLTLTRGLFASAMRSASRRLSAGPGADAIFRVEAAGLEDDGACPGAIAGSVD